MKIQTVKWKEENSSTHESGMESLKKSHTEVKLEIKYLGTPTGIGEARLTNRIQEIEKGIRDIEDKTEETDALVKENVKYKTICRHKTSGISGIVREDQMY